VYEPLCCSFLPGLGVTGKQHAGRAVGDEDGSRELSLVSENSSPGCASSKRLDESTVRAYCLDVQTRSQIRWAVRRRPPSSIARVLRINLSPVSSTKRSCSIPIQLGNRLSSTRWTTLSPRNS
jgi:hypothetical protein